MTATATLRIGTRESRLALEQARIAMRAIAPLLGRADLVPISTHGDAISARRPRASWVASDGQFTRELERALLDGRVDLVVHSFKDLPTEPVEGLVIGAVLERADARDCLVTADGGTIEDLPFGARIGTSSPRRAAQLAAARADLIAIPIRGNVESRVARLHAGEYDALMLAAAGLDRLGIDVPQHARLPFDLFLPAPAQGALAIQVRSADAPLLAALAAVDHRPTRIAVEAERSLLRRIGGGCLAPLGALGEVTGDTLRLRAAYETADGDRLRAESSGTADDAAGVVARVAERIAAG
ncbi:MAG TPA: hydroxymethylbilane synthase [Candidatus Limnocylindrales bacterium]|nr:hydroxymethylbilane synthase [Candidatus Limnocylindrales bacterium]